MARALVVGCGCRGRMLGAELAAAGWQVRGTSRDEAGASAIEAAGIEAAVADPDRLGTVLDLVADVAVVVWPFASATGEAAAELHGPRLERILELLVDTPVRGFAYEAAGALPAETLARGTAIVRAASERFRIPVAVVEEDPADPGRWARAAAAAVAGLAATE